jgi:hypothetical protein
MVSEEQDRLHGLGGDTKKVGPGEVRVYWVSQIREASGKMLAGCAGHAPHKPALMISAIGSRWTLAHELGHVLLTKQFSPVHSSEPNNLMFSPTAQADRVPVLSSLNLFDARAPTTSRRAVPVASVARAAQREQHAATRRTTHRATPAVHAASFSGRHCAGRENTIT